MLCNLDSQGSISINIVNLKEHKIKKSMSMVASILKDIKDILVQRKVRNWKGVPYILSYGEILYLLRKIQLFFLFLNSPSVS